VGKSSRDCFPLRDGDPFRRSKDPSEYILRVQNTPPESPQSETEVQRLIRAEKEHERVVVSRSLEAHNSLSQNTLKSLRSAKRGTAGLVAPKAAGCLDIYVASESVERAVIRLPKATVRKSGN
jgi:hypothetical protein